MVDDFKSSAVGQGWLETLRSHRELREIMIHEFPKRIGWGSGIGQNDAYGIENYDVNEDPLVAYLTSLTADQRNFLQAYSPLERCQQTDRLVMFVTHYRKQELQPMCGLWLEQNYKPLMSNAKCAIFHCHQDSATPQDPSTPQLICYTERMWVFLHPKTPRPPTVEANFNKLDVPAPKVGALSAGRMPGEGSGHFTVWFRLVDGRGEGQMDHNTLHAMTNTNGCWMLFRNHNWPKDQYATAIDTYRNWRKASGSAKHRALQEGLPKIGYVDPPGSQSVSHDNEMKFLRYDRNYAFYWMCRRILGIRYFASAASIPDDDDPLGNYHNDFNIAADALLPTAPDEEKDRVEEIRDAEWVKTHSGAALPARGDTKARVQMLNTHEIRSNWLGPEYKDEWLEENVLGFKAQPKWGPFAGPRASIEQTCADVVLYWGD